MAVVGVCGSVNMDVFGYVRRAPGEGETVLGERLAYAPGGKGANQAVAAARAGAEVRFCGACGTDAFGETLCGVLGDEGIDLGQLERTDEPTGVALIVVSADGANRIVVIPGANATVRGPGADPAVDVWLVQAEVPVAAVEQTLAAARAAGARAVINPSPSGVVPAELVRRFDLAIVNEREAAALSDPPAHMVVTLGGRGARLEPAGTLVPAPAADVVDTTGAGDALAGTLAAAWACGEPLERAVALGVAAGSLAVERYGCIPALPTRKEIEQRAAAG